MSDEIKVPEKGVYFLRTDEPDGSRSRVYYKDGEMVLAAQKAPVQVVGMTRWVVGVVWIRNGKSHKHSFPMVNDPEIADALIDAVGIGVESVQAAQPLPGAL